MRVDRFNPQMQRRATRRSQLPEKTPFWQLIDNCSGGASVPSGLATAGNCVQKSVSIVTSRSSSRARVDRAGHDLRMHGDPFLLDGGPRGERRGALDTVST